MSEDGKTYFFPLMPQGCIEVKFPRREVTQFDVQVCINYLTELKPHFKEKLSEIPFNPADVIEAIVDLKLL
jgi:hypothetical protein